MVIFQIKCSPMNNIVTIIFVIAQIKEIENYTFGKLLCKNTMIEKVQSQAFAVKSHSNQLMLCSDNKGFEFGLF